MIELEYLIQEETNNDNISINWKKISLNRFEYFDEEYLSNDFEDGSNELDIASIPKSYDPRYYLNNIETNLLKVLFIKIKLENSKRKMEIKFSYWNHGLNYLKHTKIFQSQEVLDEEVEIIMNEPQFDNQKLERNERIRLKKHYIYNDFFTPMRHHIEIINLENEDAVIDELTSPDRGQEIYKKSIDVNKFNLEDY